MNNSLEFNWVCNVDKSMSLPVVVFAPVPDCAGYFQRLLNCEWLVEDGVYYPRDHGLIVVSTLESDKNFGSVIAHEWRHLWQYWHGWEYFTKSKSEADAFKFEVKYSRACFHDYWLALLTGAKLWY